MFAFADREPLRKGYFWMERLLHSLVISSQVRSFLAKADFRGCNDTL